MSLLLCCRSVAAADRKRARWRNIVELGTDGGLVVCLEQTFSCVHVSRWKKNAFCQYQTVSRTVTEKCVQCGVVYVCFLCDQRIVVSALHEKENKNVTNQNDH